MHSAIFQGWVRHRRFVPRMHEFRYAMTMFYLDLDELPELFDDVRGWSYNERNLGWFRRGDYLGDPEQDLASQVRAEVERQQGYCPKGAVRMLANVRIWGMCFNPVTLYYCFEPAGDKPSVILAQVNNTPWNERYCYVIPCSPRTGKARTGFAKNFHVSPFNPMDMNYRWVSSVPEEKLLVHMENWRAGERHMDATLNLERQTWSAQTLQSLLWRQPWMTAKVPAAIYWQALKLFIKRVPVYPHKDPAPISSPRSRTILITERNES